MAGGCGQSAVMCVSFEFELADGLPTGSCERPIRLDTHCGFGVKIAIPTAGRLPSTAASLPGSFGRVGCSPPVGKWGWRVHTF